ncbi:trypsin-like protease isoform X2 [Portunus trituberculatus]|uniref:trypsin-like protease isoform X2 n=1 Tax=Portunus trituberculatus TaxID=210409 RepID=UPI001E1CDEB5|nr:trypsin-like protease isoform X2 [Portunus trituberculatus]
MVWVWRLLLVVVCLVCCVTVTEGRGDGREDSGGTREEGGAAAQIMNIFGVASEEAAPVFSSTHNLNTSSPRKPRLWWAWWPFKTSTSTNTTTSTTSRPISNLTAISPPISVSSPSSIVGVCGLSGRVVGGNDVEEGVLPWVVGVRDKRNITYCGGALISPRHVLTAAHCMARDLNKFPLHVSLGEHRAFPRHTVRVAHALYHSHFDRDVPEGAAVTVVGWGATSEDGNISSVLKEAKLDVLPKGSCIDAYSSSFIPSKMICAGKLNGAADACQGDSGGPLIQRGGGEIEEDEEKAAWVVVGVVSFGNGCGRPDFPGAYTRTSAFLPWLKKVLLLYP